MNAKYWKDFLIPAKMVNSMGCLAPFPKTNPVDTIEVKETWNAEQLQQMRNPCRHLSASLEMVCVQEAGGCNLTGRGAQEAALRDRFKKCFLSSLPAPSTPWKVKVKVAQTCSTHCDPTDYTVHGVLQVRILEWVAVLFSRGSSQPKDRTQVLSIADGFFTSWAIRETQEYWSG